MGGVKTQIGLESCVSLSPPTDASVLAFMDVLAEHLKDQRLVTDVRFPISTNVGYRLTLGPLSIFMVACFTAISPSLTDMMCPQSLPLRLWCVL